MDGTNDQFPFLEDRMNGIMMRRQQIMQVFPGHKYRQEH